MARCGRCRVVTVPDNQAWCVDCNENDNPSNYVDGVHISQVELPDPWTPTVGFDLDAILNRVAADTLGELEATTDMDARLAAITGGIPQLYNLVTDSLAEDCYTNNPPELAVLEGAYFGYPIDQYATPALARALTDAAKAGLVVADQNPASWGWRITEAGEQRLADLWGPDRVPPGKGGHVGCWNHGTYVVAPGDLWVCPDCPATDDEVLRQVEADAGPILRYLLNDAEVQRAAVEPNIRKFEASQRRRRAVRLVAIVAVLLTALSVFAAVAA